MTHTCPDSGGAHHYHDDPAGVRICSCGALEMTPEEELELAEIRALPLLPADRARSLYEKINERTGLDLDVDALVDGVDRPEK